MLRILFLCVHNSARSQMAEGLTRSLGKGEVEAYSAGTKATQVNPYAIEVMAEIGIDISNQRSKTIEDLRTQIDGGRLRSAFSGPSVDFDYVITLCSEAEAECPYVPGAKVLHWPLSDPAAITDSRSGALEAFAEIRDELKSRITGLLQSISE